MTVACRRCIPIGLAALAAACELPFGTDCTTDFRPALEIHVVDAATETPVEGALVWVREGAFNDTLEVVGNTAYGPGERPGTYEVRVEHVDYEPFAETGIRVTEDECHVRTREVTARLQPAL